MTRSFVKAPISAVLTDKDGYTLDTTTPVPVNPAESGAANYATSQVTLNSSTATSLVGTNSTRRAVLVTNNDTSITVYVGTASVTSSSGHKLTASSSISIPYIGAVYAIAASGSPSVSVSEIYD